MKYSLQWRFQYRRCNQSKQYLNCEQSAEFENANNSARKLVRIVRQSHGGILDPDSICDYSETC